MDQEEQARWQPTRKQVLWASTAVALLTVAILIGYRYGITLWDWIKLLIVPAVIAGGGIWFNRQQHERDLETAREQREREVEIADRRAQDEALQAYLDQVGQLLLDKDRPLRRSKEHDEVRTLARARTLTVLTRLDAEHNRSVLHFLRDSGLVGGRERSIISFSDSDLRGADLRRVDLRGADLRRADLVRANLSGAILENADLRHAQLGEANLTDAWLTNANLSGANMGGTTYRGGRPTGIAFVKGIEIIWPADLGDAQLGGADLTRANLDGVNLWGAYLVGADLTDASFGNADLSATYFDDEQLARATIADDASMPHRTKAARPRGTKYRDWRKDKEGRGEEGENGGP